MRDAAADGAHIADLHVAVVRRRLGEQRALGSQQRGVFDFVRDHGEDRVTWQPRSDVRIASVVTKTANGYVVAGRNMREVEARESTVLKLAALGWIVANVALICLWLLTPLFSGSDRHPVHAAV